MRPALAALLIVAAPIAHAADTAHPTVIELYQSQGCSSCPPANAILNAVADRADLLPLSFAVTYWDQLGWKDGFATPANTQRQWAYARAFKRAEVATPQFVVNGRAHVEGGNRAKFDAALAAADRGTGGPALALSATEARVAALTGGQGEVWLVRYDPRTIAVAIKAGENGGRTLPHRNIVRQLVRLGGWNGTAARFALPAAPAPGLLTALLVQAGPGGPIVAAARG